MEDSFEEQVHQSHVQGKHAAEVMSTLLNSGLNSGREKFIEEMANDHRTLQQSFTRLCLQWLEHIASDSYRTDGRNEQSQKIARNIMEGFTLIKARELNESGETIRKNWSVYKPSKWLGTI